MHWFWRATIAVVVGVIIMLGVYAVTKLVYNGFKDYFGIFGFCIGFFLMPQIVGICVYSLLTRRYYKVNWHVGESCCRRCGYILRRTTEPRCPECGEKI